MILKSLTTLAILAILACFVPFHVSEVSAEVSKVTAGFHNTCALTTSGGVKCWGENWHGAVGDGTVDDRYWPVKVVGLSSGVSGLASGDGHACALMASGAVKCWGYNYYGQLGDGTTTMRTLPTNVVGLASGVRSLAAGFYHTCALMVSGAVRCWGYNYYGQLGDGTITDRLTPIDVVGLSSGVLALAAGTNHTCAILNGGGVKCWGSNGYGQLGDNSYSDRLTPVSVSGLLSGVSSIAGGDGHTCAVTSSGGAKCWGYNSSGQVGDGTSFTQLVPVNVSGLTSGVQSLDAGWSHTCAVTTAGTVKCWGFNGKGQIGDGTIDSRSTPKVILASGAKAVATGPSHTCVLTQIGGVRCWGENANGEVGDGTILERLTPVDTLLWTVNGRVTFGGTAVSGVTVSCGSTGNQTTNEAGAYSFGPVVHQTSCVFTPSKNGYIFNPISLSLTVNSDTTLNITATPLKDSDRDGLPDIEEAKYGTNPNKSDSDGDLVSDGQEVSDGTSPIDGGSFQQVLSSTLCSEWNGFLGMTNIVEYVNLKSSSISATSRLYSISGEAESSASFGIKSGGQFDLIANSMAGYSSTSYGKICASLTKGNAGDLDGRMVYYKPDSSGRYQFAFAMPFSNGLTGRQYVQFNTYQPSTSPNDGSNLVTNWVQVTNLENSSQKGRLNFFSEQGVVLGSLSINVPAGGRMDVDGHRYGSNRAGLVEWVPNTVTARFQLRNVRYYYDNAVGNASFDGAFQWDGARGIGTTIVLPIDTRKSTSTVYVSNTTAAQISVEVNIYSAAGAKLKTLPAKINQHSSWSIAAGSYLANAQGVATIKSNSAGSVIATVTQVALTTQGEIQNLYAIRAEQAIGAVMRGSYNTFLNQKCRLLLTNSTKSKVSVSVSMKRFDGTSLLNGKSLTVPASGLLDYDLCASEKKPAYGLVTVQPTVPNSVTATVLRLGERDGAGDSYRFPTPVRE